MLGTAIGHATTGNRTHGCLQHFDPTVDYFPDKAVVRDAVGFTVEYRKSYKVVTVAATNAAGPRERYVLVQCGAPAPPLQRDLAGAQVVTVPVPSLFAGSTTQVSLLVDLGRLPLVVRPPAE